ncbi:MAG: tryptophan-rich sensory protein [Sphingobacteriaceae bacterium]|nr:tryptophan-rich sensory protein [Cytophagaceae bacterium]
MKTPSPHFVRVLQVLNVTCLLLTLLVNYLANALPLNGKTTGQLSDQYPNLFTPAGLTFSIWGLIYAGLLAFAGYQALSLFSRKWAAEVDPIVAEVGWLFCLTCLFNCTWIFAWHYEAVTLSVFLMISFLQTLILLNERLRLEGRLRAARPRWLVGVPFAVYWGWISIATIANVTAWLVDEGWQGFGLPEWFWAILLIAIGTFVTLTVLRRTHQWAYGLVVVWAFAGIILKRSAVEPLAPGVALAAGLGGLVIGVALLWLARRVPVQAGKLM